MHITLKTPLLAIIAFAFITAAAFGQTEKEAVQLADPSIFYDKGTYYLYGTGSASGFPVYTSTDLKTWHRQEKNALAKGESYGTQGFWAPQVFKWGKKYVMAYTANEHIAIAFSDNPLGPFKQQTFKPVSLPGRQIDPFIFKDKKGGLYLYYVRLDNGNRIAVTRLKNDYSDVIDTSFTACINAESGWENIANAKWPVTEGPSVVYNNGRYYLFYSANDFRNIDYAVGYATAPTPMGPWSKHKNNPVLVRKNTYQNGSGHGDLFKSPDGKWYYIFHTHSSEKVVEKRKAALVELHVPTDTTKSISMVPGSFRYLEAQ
jgi:xylan 1,4-beta-xylosidase